MGSTEKPPKQDQSETGVRAKTRRRGGTKAERVVADPADSAAVEGSEDVTVTGSEPSDPGQTEREAEDAARLEATKTRLKDAFTPKEERKALEAAIAQFDDAPRASVAPEERADLKQKEAAYLNAYREVEKDKTFFRRLFGGKDLKERESSLDNLRHEYDEARVTYAEALKGNVAGAEMSESFKARKTKEFNRLATENALPESTTLESFLESEMQRRRDAVGRYVAFREVVRPMAERKLAARQEALDSRGRNVFEKALGWSARHNQELEVKYGKIGARAVRAAMGAVIVSAGAAGLGAVGVIAPAGIAALAIYGSAKFTRSLIGAVAGMAAGEVAAHGYEALWGRRSLEAARKQQVTKGRDGEITLESLRRIDRSREKLATEASEITLIKRKQLIRAFTALGVGAGAAATLAEFIPVQEAVETIAGTPGAAVPGLVESEGVVQPVAPEGMLQEAVIGKNEGFNHLFEDIRASEFAGTTPVGKLLMSEEFSLSELSDKVGGFDPETGKSMLMFEGDRLLVDSNENVWFLREGEAAQLVLENDPNAPGGVQVHELKHTMLETNPGVTESTSVQVAETVSENEPTPTSTWSVEVPGPDEVSEAQPIESVPQDVTTENAPVAVDNSGEAPVTNTVPAVEGPNIFGDPYVNANGVQIDPSEPHVYENADGRLFMSGGVKESVYAQAQEYVAANDTTVFVDASYIDMLGNTVQRAIGFTPDGQGAIGMMLTDDPAVQVRPEEYIRRVQ